MRDRLADVRAKLPPEASEPEYIEATASNTMIAALTWNLESPVKLIFDRIQKITQKHLTDHS